MANDDFWGGSEFNQNYDYGQDDWSNWFTPSYSPYASLYGGDEGSRYGWQYSQPGFTGFTQPGGYEENPYVQASTGGPDWGRLFGAGAAAGMSMLPGLFGGGGAGAGGAGNSISTRKGQIPPLVAEKTAQAAGAQPAVTPEQAFMYQNQILPMLLAGQGADPYARMILQGIAGRGQQAYMPDVEAMRAPYADIQRLRTPEMMNAYAAGLGPGEFGIQSGAAEAAAMQGLMGVQADIASKQAAQEQAIGEMTQRAAGMAPQFAISSLSALPQIEQGAVLNLARQLQLAGFPQDQINAEIDRQLKAAVSGYGPFSGQLPMTTSTAAEGPGSSFWSALGPGVQALANPSIWSEIFKLFG